MVGVHATFVVASVQDIHPLRYRPARKFIGPTMRQHMPTSMVRLTVVTGARTCPKPATAIRLRRNLVGQDGKNVYQRFFAFPASLIAIAKACFWLFTTGPLFEPECSLPALYSPITLPTFFWPLVIMVKLLG